MDEDRGKLLTSREVAKILRVGQTTVSHWARNGRLPFVRLPGGHYRFFEKEVMEACRAKLDEEGS